MEAWPAPRAAGVFVRDGEVRRSGSRVQADQGLLRGDPETAMIGLVCRDPGVREKHDFARRVSLIEMLIEGSTVVLLPTYNEAQNLAPMLRAIRNRVDQTHVLVIDDGSPDGTGRIADEAAASDSCIHVAHRPQKKGLGAAYRFGYRWALDRGYARIVQMDCDFSHDPDDLSRILALLRDHPVVVGSRRVPGGGSSGWPWRRNLLSNAGSLYARTVLGSPVRDLTSGFKGFRSDALARLPIESLECDGFAFQIEVTLVLQALGVPVHEMPIQFVDRRYGQSKMDFRIMLEALVKVWSIRSRARALARDGSP